MSYSLPCRLTARSFILLETMLLNEEPGSAFSELVKRKLAGAGIWSPQDMPANVVTLDSRVTYRIDGGPAETRIVGLDRAHGPVGVTLPVSVPRGLALLGLAEGESVTLVRDDGSDETVSVVEVLYQPEAAASEAHPGPDGRAAWPGLRLVHSVDDAPKARPWSPPAGPDDPGPSAA